MQVINRLVDLEAEAIGDVLRSLGAVGASVEDLLHPRGRLLALRDRALILFLYNTGARAQEVADLLRKKDLCRLRMPFPGVIPGCKRASDPGGIPVRYPGVSGDGGAHRWPSP